MGLPCGSRSLCSWHCSLAGGCGPDNPAFPSTGGHAGPACSTYADALSVPMPAPPIAASGYGYGVLLARCWQWWPSSFGVHWQSVCACCCFLVGVSGNGCGIFLARRWPPWPIGFCVGGHHPCVFFCSLDGAWGNRRGAARACH